MSQGIRLFTPKSNEKDFPMTSCRQCVSKDHPSGADWVHVLDGSTWLSFSTLVHKLFLSFQFPSNVSMINNRKLVHRIIDLNGKGKTVVSFIRSYRFLLQKIICYEKIEGSCKTVSQKEITKYEIQVMILEKESQDPLWLYYTYQCVLFELCLEFIFWI